MASIPLPALAIQPPQPQQDPLSGLEKIQRLKYMMGQQQVQSQQVQAGAQENQLRALQLQDQGILRDSAKNLDWTDPSTFGKWIQNAQQKGVSPQTLSSLTLQRSQYQEQLAKTDTATLTANKERNNQLLGLLDPIKQEKDPDKRATLAASQAQKALSAGLVKDPQSTQIVQGLISGHIQPSDDVINGVEAGLQDHSAQIDEQLKRSEISKNTAQQGEAETNTAVKKLELQWGGNPQMQEARYRSILQNLAAKKEVSPDDMAMATAYEASQRKSTTTSDSLGVTSTNTSGPTGLAQFRQRGAAAGGGGGGGGTAAAPNAKQSIVDLIGNYQANPTLVSRMLTKHPDIIGLLHDKYPDFDQTTYDAKNKMVTSYTSGPKSNEINAINTALGHAGVADDAVDALNNNNLTALNKLGNSIGINVTGQTAAAAFKTIIHRLGPEITSAYIAGGGGEGERGANAADFSENLPPQTLHDNLSISANLLRSKISSLENQYKQTVGRDDFNQRFITPGAQASLQKFAGQGTDKSGKAPQAKTLSMATIQKAAKENGVSVDEAKRQAVAAGYSVTP